MYFLYSLLKYEEKKYMTVTKVSTRVLFNYYGHENMDKQANTNSSYDGGNKTWNKKANEHSVLWLWNGNYLLRYD